MSRSHFRRSETLFFSRVWLMWLLSTVLKCCCHGSSTEEGNRLFLPLCVLRPTCGSKPSIREWCRDGLPLRPRPGVGRTKALTARLASGALLMSQLWDMQSLAEFCLRLSETWFAEDVSRCCVFVVTRHYKVLGTWAFSWVMERSSGWRLFIPSFFVAWPPSKTSLTSWSTLITTSVRLITSLNL